MGRWSVAYNAKLGWRKTGRYWMPPIVEFHLHLSLPLLLFDFQPPDPPGLSKPSLRSPWCFSIAKRSSEEGTLNEGENTKLGGQPYGVMNRISPA